MKLKFKALAEGIGTFGLVFIGCGAIAVADRFPGSLAPSSIPPIFGLVVAAMIYTFGHISGAHFNPAVTFGFALIKRFPWREVPVYWLSQFLGAIFAVTLLYFILPEGQIYGATYPAIAAPKAILWEIVLSFFLMLVIVAVATDGRAVGIMAGAAIGATVTFDAFVGGVVTGASMNPARSLAPALFEGRFTHLWIYLVSPLIGAAMAAILYDKIRCEKPDATKNAKGCC
ncbi:MAG: MIP family channel protein [Bacteriovoracia bacterium]